MKVKVITEDTIGTLVEYKRNNILKVNHEYQRGLRWNKMQQCMFIDSIFRGYSIPAFYFHKKDFSVREVKNTHLEIVDGQQRVEAIFSYSEGAFSLLNPADDSGFRFPNFVKNEACPWGGKRFEELPQDLQEKLKNHKIVIYEITTTNENEIRDLFIRLQGGIPLTPQDKRDSWPGNFTEFVLRVGGKTPVDKWYGDPLFKEVSKVSNESGRRQLVAQIFMLFYGIRNQKKFCDLKSANIDEFYHRHVDFDSTSSEAQRFEKICRALYEAFSGKPKVAGHYLIHLFLLTDSLFDDYVKGTWEAKLAQALHDFEHRCKEAAEAAKNNDSQTQFHEYWRSYAQWTQTSSDRANTIQRRHVFFVAEIFKLLSPRKQDGKRSFNEFERQCVFFRDSEFCQYCKMNSIDHKISWDECDIHHVTPHAEGGPTKLENAALVHKDCHPKSKPKVEEFSSWWSNRKQEKEHEATEESARSTSGRRTRLSKKRMSSHVRDNKLVVEFRDDGEKEEWTLPGKQDKDGIRRVRDRAIEYARSREATYGQEMAIKKALTEAGYHVTK